MSKAKGEYIAPSLGRVSVGELAADWLARKQQATAPSHYRMLESAWRVHVNPWGIRAVADIDALAVEAWIAGMVHKVPVPPRCCGRTVCCRASWPTR